MEGMGHDHGPIWAHLTSIEPQCVTSHLANTHLERRGRRGGDNEGDMGGGSDTEGMAEWEDRKSSHSVHGLSGCAWAPSSGPARGHIHWPQLAGRVCLPGQKHWLQNDMIMRSGATDMGDTQPIFVFLKAPLSISFS